MERSGDRRRWGLGVAVLTLTVLVALVAWALFAAFDDEAALGPDDGSLVAAATPTADIVDDILGGGDEETSGRPTPVDPERVAGALVLDRLESFVDDTGTTQVVLLVRNVDTVAYANVAGVADLVGPDAGTTLATLDFVFSAIDAGEVVPIISGVEIAPDEIGDVSLSFAARGTLPTGSVRVTFRDLIWEQNSRGAVAVSGVAESVGPLEFVAVVGLLRDADDTLVGVATGFLATVTADGAGFEALGFPTGEVASVEVYGAP